MTNEDQCTHSAQSASAGPDLSKSIDLALERSPGEHVRSVRVFGDWYRCNWWINTRADWLGVAASRITRSRFLHVVLTAEPQQNQPQEESALGRLSISERT